MFMMKLMEDRFELRKQIYGRILRKMLESVVCLCVITYQLCLASRLNDCLVSRRYLKVLRHKKRRGKLSLLLRPKSLKLCNPKLKL